ncbi:MAG TPA: hypothetical protein VFQ44_01845 [Streptosporangiaceae bacterium]|nr:hypothetical protein [Streptosporangiaceae bacterium]
MPERAQHLIDDYLARTGLPRDTTLDAAYQLQWHYLRDMLHRLEVIMDDEQIPASTAGRIIRCLLYGSPHPADAELRMEQHKHKQMADLLTPPGGLHPRLAKALDRLT